MNHIIDINKLGMSADGRGSRLLVLDSDSGEVVSINYFPDIGVGIINVVEEVLEKVWADQSPTFVYTDMSYPFSGNYFNKLCTQHGVEIVYFGVSPRGKGKAERMQKKLDKVESNINSKRTIEEINVLMDEWRIKYNKELKPMNKPTSCIVNEHTHIHYDGKNYCHPKLQPLIGKHSVQCSPIAGEKLRVFHRGQYVCDAEPIEINVFAFINIEKQALPKDTGEGIASAVVEGSFIRLHERDYFNSSLSQYEGQTLRVEYDLANDKAIKVFPRVGSNSYLEATLFNDAPVKTVVSDSDIPLKDEQKIRADFQRYLESNDDESNTLTQWPTHYIVASSAISHHNGKLFVHPKLRDFNGEMVKACLIDGDDSGSVLVTTLGGKHICNAETQDNYLQSLDNAIEPQVAPFLKSEQQLHDEQIALDFTDRVNVVSASVLGDIGKPLCSDTISKVLIAFFEDAAIDLNEGISVPLPGIGELSYDPESNLLDWDVSPQLATNYASKKSASH